MSSSSCLSTAIVMDTGTRAMTSRLRTASPGANGPQNVRTTIMINSASTSHSSCRRNLSPPER